MGERTRCRRKGERVRTSVNGFEFYDVGILSRVGNPKSTIVVKNLKYDILEDELKVCVYIYILGGECIDGF